MSQSLWIYTVTPSPYQRDLFQALKKRFSDLKVVYFEKHTPDSPWPDPELETWEETLQGYVLGKGRLRCHWHSRLPRPPSGTPVILNTAITALSTQFLMRFLRKQHPLFFMGELLRTHHDWKNFPQSFLLSPLHSFQGILAIGEHARDHYLKRFPHLPVLSIPYSPDLSAFLNSNLPEFKTIPPLKLLFAGQMIPRKGIDVLLKVFSRLVDESHEVELSLMGREAELSQWLRTLSPAAASKIHNFGFIPPNQMAEHFSKHHLFLLPSRHDGWGVVVNQALAAGLPVIGSRQAYAARELVVPHRNGWLIEGGDEQDLYQTLTHTLRDQPNLELMSHHARETARHLSPENTACAIQKFLQRHSHHENIP